MRKITDFAKKHSFWITIIVAIGVPVWLANFPPGKANLEVKVQDAPFEYPPGVLSLINEISNEALCKNNLGSYAGDPYSEKRLTIMQAGEFVEECLNSIRSKLPDYLLTDRLRLSDLKNPRTVKTITITNAGDSEAVKIRVDVNSEGVASLTTKDEVNDLGLINGVVRIDSIPIDQSITLKIWDGVFSAGFRYDKLKVVHSGGGVKVLNGLYVYGFWDAFKEFINVFYLWVVFVLVVIYPLWRLDYKKHLEYKKLLEEKKFSEVKKESEENKNQDEKQIAKLETAKDEDGK